MKISLNWLRDFVPFQLIPKENLGNVVVGYVKKLEKHPNADSLNIAQVDIGNETVQIVCGGVNLVAHRHVPVALPGAILPGNFQIQKSKIRGEESHGMICACEEIGLGTNGPREIWLLDKDKKWKPGTPLVEALGLDKQPSPKEIAQWITNHTAEVEGLIPADEYLHNIVAGKLLSYKKIEGSDKLHVGQFDIGWKQVQIVFGSVYKIEVGEILPLALPGAVLPKLEIKVAELGGIRSEGMVCGDDEMGLQNSAEGITRFPSNTPLGKPVAEVLGLSDLSLDIDNKSLTHRPDLWGHYGMARELSAILKKKLRPFTPKNPLKSTAKQTKLGVKIVDREISPRFSGCIVTGIQITESPQWMKSRLQAVGIRPINNIVDITNYVMVELGQPMHAYDRSIVGTDALEVRFAKKGEILETIDHKSRSLSARDPLVTNGKIALGLAGIMGGAGSEIADDTTEIILEAAAWNPVIIRKSSTEHGLRSDASQRFEKGIDPALTELAILRALELIAETCPNATLATPVTTISDWKPKTIKIAVDTKVVCSKIGVPITTTEMVRILEALDFKVTIRGTTLEVTVPSHRATGDVEIAEDIVEEIARHYGYNQIPAILPELPIRLPIENGERDHKHSARDILAYQLGFTETLNYSFYSENDFRRAGLDETHHIVVLNALSSEQTHMRTSLIPGLLINLQKNAKRKAHLKFFEIGRTYLEVGEFMPLEEKWIGLTVATQEKTEVFYEMKGALETFLERFGSPPALLRECTTPPPYAHPNKCIEVLIKGQTVGYGFEVHPAIAKNFELEHRAACFELNFTKLVACGRTFTRFEELPRFPSIFFDISLLIDRRKPIADVERALRKADSAGLLRTIKLFDIYEGKGIPETKKSLAFNLELRHDERTLTEDEFRSAQQAVFTAVEKLGGEVRKG